MVELPAEDCHRPGNLRGRRHARTSQLDQERETGQGKVDLPSMQNPRTRIIPNRAFHELHTLCVLQNTFVM